MNVNNCIQLISECRVRNAEKERQDTSDETAQTGGTGAKTTEKGTRNAEETRG